MLQFGRVLGTPRFFRFLCFQQQIATTINTMANNNNNPLWDNACFLSRLVAASVKISERAGKVIKSVMSEGNLKIVTKGVNDLQTEADRSAQYCIVNSLEKQFGEWLCIIGEEAKEEESHTHELELDVCNEVLEFDKKCKQEIREITDKDVVVWVDPLDGTNEFAQAAKDGSSLVEQVTILIGIGYKGRSVAGIIHQPYYGFESLPKDKQGRTIWAIEGIQPQGINVKQIDNQKRTVVTTRSHGTATVNDALEALADAQLMHEVLRVGGAGYKVLKTLEGCHAYVFASPGCKKWDTCAPEAILHAAGGRLTDMHGNSLKYGSDIQRLNSAGVLATAPNVEHNTYLNAVPQHVKDKLHVVAQPKK